MATKRPRCTAKTKKGSRCTRYAVDELDVCIAHAPEEVRDSRGFGGPQEGSGRPRKPRIAEVLRERIEADVDRWLAPLEAALGAGKPVVTWDQAEGKHSIQYVDDPALGMKALKLAWDRVYGRPRQELELTGSGGGAVEFEITNPEVREAMHGLVRAVAAARES